MDRLSVHIISKVWAILSFEWTQFLLKGFIFEKKKVFFRKPFWNKLDSPFDHKLTIIFENNFENKLDSILFIFWAPILVS